MRRYSKYFVDGLKSAVQNMHLRREQDIPLVLSGIARKNDRFDRAISHYYDGIGIILFA